MVKGKFRESLKRISRTIETYSIIGLLISISFSLYQTYSNNKQTDEQLAQLDDIKTSISTRSIGIFPSYLPQINKLLSDINNSKPIIIFEDVLYYGIFSSPGEFKKMTYKLLELSETNQITIVYYDITGRVFKKCIQESRIQQRFLGKIESDRRELIKQMRQNSTSVNRGGGNTFSFADSIVSEKYFAFSRADKEFGKKIKQYLIPLYDSKNDRDSLFFHIDEVKNENLGKNPDKIIFNDFLITYQGISQVLMDAFNKHNVELIAMDEFHIMSCWQHDDRAILAFPSKYATDEIGFFTQDPVFTKYIFTMLDGVKSQRGE